MQSRILNWISLGLGGVGLFCAFPWLEIPPLYVLLGYIVGGVAGLGPALAILFGGAWIGATLALFGLVIGFGAKRRAGRNFCLVVLVVAVIRLSLGGGFI